MIVARRVPSTIAIIAALFLPTLVSAQYYIDPAGNDSNSGTSPDNAWASLSKIRTAGAGPVYLKRGGTWEGGLSLRDVTVSTYGEGARPVIVTSSASGFPGAGGISVLGGATLEGIEVEGEGRIGIMVSGSNNTVRDCEVDGSSGTFELGFGIMGEGNLITRNTVHDLRGMTGDSGDMNTSGGAEAYMVMASNNEISYNAAINCWGENQTLGGAEGGCLEIVNGQARAIIENVRFHHNYCERSVGLFEACSGNFSGTDAIQEKENHGIIRNSYVAYNIAVDAMWLYLLQPVNTDFSNIVFEHNTIIHTSANEQIPQQGASSFGLLVNQDRGYNFTLETGNITVRNNLFVVTGGGANAMFSAPPTGDHYNNMFSPSVPWGYQTGAGEFAAADPGLTSDFRLAAGSAAIDVGSPDAIQKWTDFDGNAVPLGDGPDIGASEYCDDADCSASVQQADTGGTLGEGGTPSSTGGTSGAGVAGGSEAPPMQGTGGVSGGDGGIVVEAGAFDLSGGVADGGATPPANGSNNVADEKSGCGCHIAGADISSPWPWQSLGVWLCAAVLLAYRQRS